MTVPLEAAFLIECVHLVSPGGRILAVLPGSIVRSKRLKTVREYLLQAGSIRFVHELPARSFPWLEGRVYLLVFEKRGVSRRIVLMNHKLWTPDRLPLGVQSLGPELRLDYGHQASKLFLRSLESELPNGDWTRLADTADIVRGTATVGSRGSLHTTGYRNGAWDPSSRRTSHPTIGAGAIAVARVGRGCARSFGLVISCRRIHATDCVLTITPKRSYGVARLLFALRCLSALPETQDLLCKGVGAQYIPEEDLKSLRIPFGLASSFKGEFRMYKAACGNGRFDRMVSIENALAARLRSSAEGAQKHGASV